MKKNKKVEIYPNELEEFINFFKNDKNLNIVGLMCIPPVNEEPKKHFKLLQGLAFKNNLNELSIGMSNDYLDALSFYPRYIKVRNYTFGKRS